jgi:hypothetical protein
MTRRRRLISLLAALVVVLAAVVVVLVVRHHTSGPPASLAGPVITIGAPLPAPAIPPGFVGLSLEQNSLEKYTGTNSSALDPVFLQLIRNIDPGQDPVLRLGGDSTDKSWYPVPDLAQPPWVKFTFTPSWLTMTHALAAALHAKLIVGVNFEADSAKITAAEASALLSGLGRSAVQALELGNEPELYSGFGWYRNAAGVPVLGRGPSWSPAQYAQQASALAHALPAVPLAGPAVGSTKWIAALPTILAGDRALSLVTVHAYPLKHCTAASHPTIGQLLAPSSSNGLAAGVAPAVREAARHGLKLRVGEMNAVSCGGEPGVSNSFASALWSLDTLFAMARTGVAGVNLHTSPRVSNRLFAFAQPAGRWTGSVYPVYYGILMFARAVPAGSRLLSVAGPSTATVPVWAVRTPHGQVHVVVINKRLGGSQTITIRVPGAHGAGTVERLNAPSLAAESGETLAGQSFGASTSTGLAAGARRVERPIHRGDEYRVTVPAHSAALLTV